MSKDSGIVETIARMRVAIDEVLDTETKKHKEPKGVIARPGDIVIFKQSMPSSNQKRVVINKRTGRDHGTWIEYGLNIINLETGHTGSQAFSYYTTLDGRPVIGFRDNDEGEK